MLSFVTVPALLRYKPLYVNWLELVNVWLSQFWAEERAADVELNSKATHPWGSAKVPKLKVT